MADQKKSNQPSLSGRSTARGAGAPEGSRVVNPDYGMPGSKEVNSPIVPLMWLLLPFFFCVIYGVLTR